MNNISNKDFKNVCRTCMLSCDVKFTQDKLISNIFYKLTDIHFEMNDELPQHICLKCFQKLNEIHEFASQCKRTHVSLLNCINNFKNAQINEEQKTEGYEPLKTEKEITIDKHEYNFFKVEVLGSPSGCLIDMLKLKEHIKEEKNNELEENMIAETSDDQTINYSQDDLLDIHTENIKVEIKEESNDNINLNDSNEDTYSSENKDSSYIDSVEYNEEVSNKTEKIHYKCDVCNEAFNELKALKKHRSLSSCECPFQCEQCLKSFSHSSNLNRHMASHSSERRYKCEKCSKSFSQSSNLKRHMTTHSSDRPFKCEKCLKSFTQSSHLKNHLCKHGRFYKCEQCFKSFLQSSNLKKHMATHSGECLYKCAKCSKSFTHSSKLKIHMRTHGGERQHKCNQCLKTFKQSAHLKIHMRAHNGERPYKCEQCSKSFIQSCTLKEHMRMHTGECPYQCEQCSKSFTRSYSLKIHMRTHSGERPYICPHPNCNWNFVDISALRRHIRRLHGEAAEPVFDV